MGKKSKALRRKKRKASDRLKVEKKKATKAAKKSPPPPPPTVYYDELPENHQYRWILNSDTDVMFRYAEMIRWVREMGTSNGEDYGGIRSLSSVGYPLIEIEVIHESKSARFLISRASLYILAFCSPSFRWRVFKDSEIQIVGEAFENMDEQDAKYTGHPWRFLGPREMIDAFEELDKRDEISAAKGCMIFMVHFCEAARFTLVERIVQKSLMPRLRTWVPPDPDEDEIQIVENNENDISSHMKQAAIVNLNKSIKAPKQLQAYVKGYKQLCKAWYTYIMSERTECHLSEEIATACGIANTTVLGHCLGVLCATNLEKLPDS